MTACKPALALSCVDKDNKKGDNFRHLLSWNWSAAGFRFLNNH